MLIRFHPDGVASRIGEGGFDEVGFALVLRVIGGDDCRADDLLFPGVLPLSSIACIVEIFSLSEQPEVVWVGLVSVLRFRFHQYRYSVKNLTACRQLVRRHVQRKKMRYRCYPVLSSVRSAACESEILSDMCVCSLLI